MMNALAIAPTDSKAMVKSKKAEMVRIRNGEMTLTERAQKRAEPKRTLKVLTNDRFIYVDLMKNPPARPTIKWRCSFANVLGGQNRWVTPIGIYYAYYGSWGCVQPVFKRSHYGSDCSSHNAHHKIYPDYTKIKGYKKCPFYGDVVEHYTGLGQEEDLEEIMNQAVWDHYLVHKDTLPHKSKLWQWWKGLYRASPTVWLHI